MQLAYPSAQKGTTVLSMKTGIYKNQTGTSKRPVLMGQILRLPLRGASTRVTMTGSS
jgi:hypothetical protein